MEPSLWHNPPSGTVGVHSRLRKLECERALASLEGIASNPAYMADLAEEIVATRHAYVGAAVTEIASPRRALSRPQVG